MLLESLLSGLDYKTIQGTTSINIDGMTIDSRKISENYLFVCIKGIRANSHNFAEEAILKGATVLLINEEIEIENKDVTIIMVKDTRLSLAFIAGNFYDKPYEKVKMIGVTGTNGKTSVTYFIEKIFEDFYKKPCGVIGTVGIKIGTENVDIKSAATTTPETIELMEILNEMSKSVDLVVMEVSSHALDLRKTAAVFFDIGIFTNLTQDHLDYHITFDNYLNAKAKLFKQCKIGIVNIDDNYSDQIIKKSNCEILSFGIENDCDVKAANIKHFMDSVLFDVKYNNETYNFEVNIPGTFTVYNALAAISAGIVSNIPIKSIQESLKHLSGIPGRIQNIKNNKGFAVFVDYAHTPDGLKNIIESVKEFTDGKVITVFGCGGDRDKTKRALMGKISGELSDYTIITSDNPRTENPENILTEIEIGIKETNSEYIKLVNREDAISYAINHAQKGDSVIIAGKGHEDYQVFADKTIHFDDREVARKVLEEI